LLILLIAPILFDQSRLHRANAGLRAPPAATVTDPSRPWLRRSRRRRLSDSGKVGRRFRTQGAVWLTDVPALAVVGRRRL
jgi:hypothetical protein